MLSSLAEAACALDRRDYLLAAIASGSFLLDSMIADGYLKHTYKDGKAKIDGYLADYALVIDGLLGLYQITLSGNWLKQAIRLTEVMTSLFWDEPTSTFYDTGKRHEDLFVRPRSTFDGALPSGSSSATLVLLKLAKLTDNEQLEQIAARALRSMAKSMSNYPLGFSNWLCALDLYLSQPKEITIVGPRNDSATQKLLHTICTTWLPNKVVAAYDPDDPTLEPQLKLTKGRQMINNQPTVYVCEQYTCREPITDPASLSTQLRDT
jgi:uncharacterized protein YyaL (SSP411 family)